MALVTPTLLSSTAFDATATHTFYFLADSGDQVTGNAIRIMLNDGSGTIAYSGGKLDTYRTERTIPANALTNGTYYIAQVRTYNSSGQASEWSNAIQFKCFNAPSLSLTNIPSTNIISNSSFQFEAEYAKALTTHVIDTIQTYVFNLYDSNNILISTSGLQYFSTTPTPPVEFNYTFRGFDNEVKYGIQVIATTLNGMVADTGIKQFDVQYDYPTAFSLLELKNICDEGYVRIISNIAVIDGVAVPDPPTYIEGKEIDLSASGSSVSWSEGYSVSGDLTLGVWGRKFTNNARVVLMNTELDTDTSKYRIEIYRRTGYPWDDSTTQKTYFECYLYSGNDMPAYVYSNYITTPADTDTICIWLTRKNNILDLQIINKGVVE